MSSIPVSINGPTLSPQSFARFSTVITRELGIKMPREKSVMLQSRLLRRLRQLSLQTLEEYQELLFSRPRTDPEWVEFINLVTTNKTDFFRESVHFDLLTAKILPALSARLCKVWCAGCSSGEEPYTLAMVLSEYKAAHPGFDFSILATDISTRVLEHAIEAIYDDERVAPVPADLRQRYFLRSKNRQDPQVRVVPELREKVRFKRLNFMDTEYDVKEDFQIVFFRNVMIYFSRETQLQVVGKLCQRLQPGGFLFTGHAESLLGLDLPIRQITTALFQKNK